MVHTLENLCLERPLILTWWHISKVNRWIFQVLNYMMLTLRSLLSMIGQKRSEDLRSSSCLKNGLMACYRFRISRKYNANKLKNKEWIWLSYSWGLLQKGQGYPALCWIKNEKPWKQYVQHHVNEIRKLTNKEDWKHCPGKDNPADIPSRGLSAKDLASCAIWFNGPEFLYLPESQWPCKSFDTEDSSAMEEIVKSKSHTL